VPDYNLGTARGRIDIDASGATRGAEQASRAAQRTQRSWEGASRGLVAGGGALAGIGATVGAGFALAVNSAADFEKQISGIAAVSGATGPELESLRKKALQLGKDTAFSASEAAQAMEELVKAGLPLEDVLNGAADAAVALAAAGGVDMPEAAAQISNAMNQFGIAAKDAGAVADLIAGAANASAIDVGEFGQALKQAGAVANLAGVDFKDTATAIALMGQAGIAGSDAGTSLKTFFNNLQPTTEKQIALFRELGLMTKDGSNAFYDQAGNLKSLSEVSGILNTSLKNMTAQQKQAALETLFGSDAIRAAAILSNQGAAGFDKMAAAMGKVSAEDVAATRMDNLNGKIEQLKGSLETAAIVIGSVLIPALTKIVDFVTTLINKFLELSPTTQKIILAVVGITAAIVTLLGIVATIVGAIGLFASAIAPLAAALGIGVAALTGIIAVIPIVIAAIVLLGIIIYKNWDRIKAFTIKVFNAIKGFLVRVWQSIAGFFVSAFNKIKSIFTTVFKAIAMVVMAYVNIWKAIITTGLNAILAVWRAVWGFFGPLVKAVLGLVLAVIKLALALWLFAFRTGLNVIMSVVRTVFNAIRAVVTTYLRIVLAIFRAVWGAVSGPVKAALNLVKSIVSAGISAVISFIKRLASIGATIGGYFAKVVTAVSQKIADVVRLAAGLAGRVLSAVGNLGGLLFGAGKDIIQGLIDGVTSMIGKLTDKLNFITGLIPDEKGPKRVDLRLLEPSGKYIMSGLISGIERQIPSLQRTLSGVTANISGNVTPTVPTPRSSPAPVVAGGRNVTVNAPITVQERVDPDVFGSTIAFRVRGL
jgi:TP901 family phage tail tape measure protein